MNFSYLRLFILAGVIFRFAGEKARALSRKVELSQDALPSGEDQDRLLDAITLTTGVMDEDLREAIVNDEAFEQLDDSFVLQATAEDFELDGTDDFDYDAHMPSSWKQHVALRHSENEDEFSDFEDEGGTEVLEPEDRDDAQRVLDKLFEKTLAEEYDDEQLGELEENDPETRGNETLDGELLAAVVEDYVFVQQEIADAEGRLGNPVRTGNRLKQVFEEALAYEYDENADTEDEEEPEDQIARVEREKMELQELFKSNQYLLRQERERWDCETITLDNHPTVLQEEIPTRRKQKKQQVVATSKDALLTIIRVESQILR
ncbi:hypothetical protein PsorP6_004448 [Peronosclerospora sorghi]|uniref:Uncharacterized protein n=1 Tax=Peronosclerospora sorghi TaxID=230839 RepID=A0ACC0VNM0_9STRA|nr:hypothetical protein PsorP6_004448 [Peronosclerospora sorghi]